MTDKPILFSAPMVRANLREIEKPGTGKTQTRRVLTPQPEPDMGLIGLYAPRLTAVFGYVTPDADLKVALRYIPGDRLYVREAWRAQEAFDSLSPIEIGQQFKNETGEAWCPAFYEADQRCDETSAVMWQQSPPGRLRQGMHMPRWASRITLIVEEVRVQRLQEISEADAIAEGVEPRVLTNHHNETWWFGAGKPRATARSAYRDLWDSLNADRGYGWDANPWVCAITFRPILGNIDQIGGAT